MGIENYDPPTGIAGEIYDEYITRYPFGYPSGGYNKEYHKFMDELNVKKIEKKGIIIAWTQEEDINRYVIVFPDESTLGMQFGPDMFGYDYDYYGSPLTWADANSKKGYVIDKMIDIYGYEITEIYVD